MSSLVCGVLQFSCLAFSDILHVSSGNVCVDTRQDMSGVMYDKQCN